MFMSDNNEAIQPYAEGNAEELTEVTSPRESQWERIMRSQTITVALQLLGALAAAAAGTARPLTTLLFGNLVNLYNSKGNEQSTHLKHEINNKAFLLFCIFIAQWACVCTYSVLFSIAAMRYTMRLRALYLKAVLSQDIEHVSPSNAATDLSTNISVIEDAMAEKMGTVVSRLQVHLGNIPKRRDRHGSGVLGVLILRYSGYLILLECSEY
jgi:hypothetical protein